MIASLMNYLQQSDFKGSKFHEPESLYITLMDFETLNPKL
jgi:hypothetical protein